MDFFDKTVFLHSMKNGFGLTKTCQLMGYDPKEVSEYLKGNPSILEECRKATEQGFKVLLAASNNAVNERKFDKWKSNIDYTKNIITTINLWECFCKKEEITIKKICLALTEYKSLEEAATAIGLSSMELNTKILTNPALGRFIHENKLFNR